MRVQKIDLRFETAVRRNQVLVLMDDALRLKAPRFVKSIQESGKEVFAPGCGTAIYI
jgi:hypothetical protein